MYVKFFIHFFPPAVSNLSFTIDRCIKYKKEGDTLHHLLTICLILILCAGGNFTKAIIKTYIDQPVSLMPV